MNKHAPQPGGYFVLYEGGYTSWSPADAFEAGYTPVTDSAVSISLEEIAESRIRAATAESVTMPADLYRKLLDLAEQGLLVGGAEPAQVPSEKAQMLNLANRITESANPEEDERLEVAYAIARCLKLDWPSAYAQPRRVTPHECPKCHALWLFWPKEVSGFDQDTLNLRSAKSCDYCEPAGVKDLIDLSAISGGQTRDAMPAPCTPEGGE